MIIESLYLSEVKNLDKVQRLTELALDELEQLVGRFNKNSHRAGLLRGELIKKIDGEVILRHHFNKKAIWRKE